MEALRHLRAGGVSPARVQDRARLIDTMVHCGHPMAKDRPCI
jgi:hypothetical protein